MSKKESQLAEWVNKLTASPTAELESTVEKLQQEGKKLYKLGLGQPDFPTPDRAKQAAIEAIHQNFTGYTNTAGINPLRQAIAQALLRDTGQNYDMDEIVVTVGGKHALFNALCTICNPGDEVIIPIPYWVSFSEQVKFAGATPVFVPTLTEDGYKVTPGSLKPFVKESTRAIIINNPNNPSGAVYSEKELLELSAFCKAHELWVISDEVYSTFVYTEDGHKSIAAFPGMKERTIVINAVSKAYSMTGWRIGYSAAPKHISYAMLMLQSHTTSNPTSISQLAAKAALEGSLDELESIRKEYKERRDILIELIREINGFDCLQSEGAFYVWVDVSSWIGKEIAGKRIDSADDLANILLIEANVVVMPGRGFGSPNYLRFSFAASLTELREGAAAIATLLGKKSAQHIG